MKIRMFSCLWPGIFGGRGQTEHETDTNKESNKMNFSAYFINSTFSHYFFPGQFLRRPNRKELNKQQKLHAHIDFISNSNGKQLDTFINDLPSILRQSQLPVLQIAQIGTCPRVSTPSPVFEVGQK